MAKTETRSTIDAAEIEKFSKLAEQWWDPHGKFKPLHKFNPARLEYIRRHAQAHFNLDANARAPLRGLTLLDIGCGGGLLCEPMARLGAEVTGLDAAPNNIKIAELHAQGQGLRIDYRAGTVEELSRTQKRFDIVLNMEVVEHVADVPLFMSASARLLKPGGMMITATLNRTLKAYALAIIGAEYVLGWLPRGTHSWEKFITPGELARHLEEAGLNITDRAGVVYHPLSGQWRLSHDTDVNYMIAAARPA